MINHKVEAKGDYYSQLRMPILALIKGTPKRVLELGCAGGQTLAFLKERGAEYTVGIEVSPAVAHLARERGVDRVIEGDIEALDLNLDSESFDLIVAGHVLEHLVNPWAVLKKLRSLLKVNGQIVGGLPNVRHHGVLFPLLFSGKWKYEDSGVMDWTHLRFFSKTSVIELLEGADFEIEALVPELPGPRSQMANRLTCHFFRNFLSYAYNFSAYKRSR